MNRGPSLEDLINSIQQDVFDQHGEPSLTLPSSESDHVRDYQVGVWDEMGTSEMTSTPINHYQYQLKERKPETLAMYQDGGRPQTPYYHSAGQRISLPVSDVGRTSQEHWNQAPSNFTTTVHEEVRFTPSPSSSVPNRTVASQVTAEKMQIVGNQSSSPRDSQFVPQPPIEPRKSRTRSSIRRAAKLLLNRSKQVLSSSDSNISSSNIGTPSPLGKESKREGGSSVAERLNKNRARMGELLKNSKLKERKHLSDGKENSPVYHSNNNNTILYPGREMNLYQGSSGRRFHSAENINSSVLSSDSSHNSMSDMNDVVGSSYLDDVSFDGSSGNESGGYALRRTSSGPIHHNHKLMKEIHRGYHTADSDTDSCVSRSDSHCMAVQTRLASGQQVKNTRDALRKLHRNQSFNGQQSRPGGLQRRSSASGPLKGDHTIQPFIQADRSHESYLIDQWKEQGARPKYSSTESLETEYVSHEVFPDTAIRSDSDDHGSHRGSRSSLSSCKHSRTASPCRSVRFEDDDQEVFTNGDVKNSDHQRRTSPGYHREVPGIRSRTAEGKESNSVRYRDKERPNESEVCRREKRQDEETGQLRTQRPRSPLVKSMSHDGRYPIKTTNDVQHRFDSSHEDGSRDSTTHNDETGHLQNAVEPAYEEVKRAKKAYSIPPNYYYDAILAHSAWDDYKKKLQDEERRASIHGDMSLTFAKNRDEYAKLSGSNLSIASQTSLSEKMQSIGHATKQKLGKVRRALSLDRLNKPASKEVGFEKESRLKRSPSLRSITSFLGKKKDKVMGSLTDVSGSGRQRRSASMVGLNTAVQEQVGVTSPSYMRKIGRVLEIHDDGTQLVRLVKPPSGPFGFYIAKGSSTNGPGIFVTRIGDGHPAKILAGLLQVGDEILEINGTVVKEEKSIDFVYDLILDSEDLLLRIRPLVKRDLENS